MKERKKEKEKERKKERKKEERKKERKIPAICRVDQLLVPYKFYKKDRKFSQVKMDLFEKWRNYDNVTIKITQ